MKPWRTLLREAVLAACKNNPVLITLLGTRFFSGRVEPWYLTEFPALSCYLTKEIPIKTDLSPPPDERRASFEIEILAAHEDGLENRLEHLATLVWESLLLPVMGAYLLNQKMPDTLLKINWLENEQGLYDDGEILLGVEVIKFDLEYRVPSPGDLKIWQAENFDQPQIPLSPIPGTPDLDNFKRAESGWDLAHTGPTLEATDYLVLKED